MLAVVIFENWFPSKWFLSLNLNPGIEIIYPSISWKWFDITHTQMGRVGGGDTKEVFLLEWWLNHWTRVTDCSICACLNLCACIYLVDTRNVDDPERNVLSCTLILKLRFIFIWLKAFFSEALLTWVMVDLDYFDSFSFWKYIFYCN